MQAATSAITHAAQAAAKHVTTPLKPILKASSSSSSTSVIGTRRTRDDAELENDSMDGSQSPRKRQKVEFDLNNIEIHEIGVRTVDEVKQEIRKALDEHTRGDDEEYDTLKEILSGKQKLTYDDEDEDADPTLPEKRRQELKVYLVALSSFTPRLGRSASGLVKSVLQCQWIGRDEQFSRVYTQFLASLVGAQGSCLTQVLSVIVDKFTDSRPSDWAVTGFPPVPRDVALERLHYSLRYLLRIFPAAKSVLTHLISNKYPYHDDSKRMHLAYVQNLLELRAYCPAMQNDIMDLIISRLVKVDVEMQMDLEDMDDQLTTMVAMALKSSQVNGNQDEEDSDDEDDHDSVSDEGSEDDEYTRVKTAKEGIEKMDFILDALFELYTPYFSDPRSDQAMEVFGDLLSEFSNIILPNLKSRHTQFLIFHFGQQSEELIDAFCGTCINIAFESQRPPVLQQAASAYLASFVARGAHVPGQIVVNIFEVLGYHLDQMRTLYEESCRGPDVRRYAPFYALMQALMYIFCFRWQDLISSVPDDVDKDDPSSYLDQEIEWVAEVKDIMRRNIYSKLNPLKVCAPVIVEQFANLAHRFRFMYVYPLLESNKRIRLSQYSVGAYSSGGGLRDLSFDMNDESWQQLDSYFPFDPYQLPTSKRWVEQDYLQWRPIPGLNEDDDEDDESDEGLGEQEEEVQEDTETDEDSKEDD